MATAPQQNPIVANLNARANLLQTGIAMVDRLQIVTGAVGTALRIPLKRMGVMTGVLLQFSVPLTITAPATASPCGPWNLVQRISYVDFAGTRRTNTNGFQLWAGNSFKQMDALSAIPAMNYATGVGPSMNYDTNILNQPTANGASSLNFSLYVPVAYDPARDLTGAVMTQTNVGEHYIEIVLANNLVNADPWLAPYTAGTITNAGTLSVNVEAFQHYIQPQNMDINLLPWIDLSTIYGYEGGYQSTDNIAAGMDKFINFPNNRSILGSLITYENGGAFTANGADISQITVLANSNTNVRNMTPRYMRELMRNMVNSDMPAGTYYIDSRRQPFMTQLYANVQARFSLISAGANSQMITQFEVQYPSGSPLPGITIAS